MTSERAHLARAHAAAPVGPADRGRPDATERARLAATLGAELRTARANVGLSQRALALLAGVHPRTIERVETGQRRPTTALLASLAHALVVPPGYSLAAYSVAEAALYARLTAAAGPSLVTSTPGNARRHQRRLRRARLAANRAASRVLRRMVNLARLHGNITSQSIERAAWRARPTVRTRTDEGEIARAGALGRRGANDWSSGLTGSTCRRLVRLLNATGGGR